MVEAAVLHPAVRRKMAARMPVPAPHRVLLRPLGGGNNRTIIHTSSEQDFLPALFSDLMEPDWRQRLAAQRRRRVNARDAILELNQPMHRRYQIALYEAVCDQPGQPRLDPARISSAGLVVRKVRQGGAGAAQREGWMKRGRSIDGWTPLLRADADPDPERASTPHPANAGIQRAMARRAGRAAVPAEESVVTLHTAPPDVCQALGRTVLLSVIPVTSTEASDLPSGGIDFGALTGSDRTNMIEHLSGYWKRHPGHAMPRAGQRLSRNWNILDNATIVADGHLGALGTFLQQALIELGVLGTGPAARAMMALLRTLRLPTSADGQQSIDAETFVRSAGAILIGREGNSADMVMPLRWPQVDADTGARLTNAALACLTEQYRARVSKPARFADDHARYVVRAFARVASHDGCPDKLVWSVDSEPFRILPWWDGEGPGPTITLPDISQMRKIKPSVAFAMPPAIANLLQGDMKALSEGEGSTSGLELGWLCSFSIPFITICAFIVLNIFLTLFDIIFRWLLFIKVCIPIPKPSPPPGGP